MIKRLYQLIKKEFLQLSRDRLMLPMIFIAPIVQLLIFSYAASTDVKDIKMAVLDRDKTQMSRELTREFTNAGYFTVTSRVDDEAGLKRALDSGAAQVALRLPHGLETDAAAGRPGVVQLLFDGSNSNTAGIALGYANQILSRRSTRLVAAGLERLSAAGGLPKVESRVRVLYNPETKSVNFMVPGLIAMILMLSAMSNTSQAIVRERDQGTLEQLIVTPVRRAELILGKIIPYAIIGLIQITVIFLVGLFWFRVPFRGSVWLLYVTAVIFLFAALGQGLFISTISRTRQQAIMATMMFNMPAMMLSGFAFPINNMPAPMYYLSFLVPARYFLVILRSIFLKGAGVAVLWPQIALLAVYGAGIFFLSVSRFQKKLGD